MTDELHNHIAGMVCETDEPGKPADVTGDLIRRADVISLISTCGDSAVTEALGQRLCCSGQMCGCRGSTVEELLLHDIRALTHARVAVKPLDWRRQSVDCEVARTVFGDAAVQNESHALKPNRWGWWMAGSYEDDSPTGYEDDLDSAKAAAQADYEARIRSALA